MKVSIIVPTYNEAGNIPLLLAEISKYANREYEVIAIDDNSTDDTWDMLVEAGRIYPLKAFKKLGKKGKSFSLFEGFERSSGDILAFIDGDRQYPAEAIFRMVDKLQAGADVAVADRKIYQDSKMRKFQSEIFKNIFGKFLLGVKHDAQAGLKVFNRQVWETVKFKPESAWTFDMEFLLKAKRAGFVLVDHEIVFAKRQWGKSKINGIFSAMQIAFSALVLRFRTIGPQSIPPVDESMREAGVGWKGKRYTTHTTLPHGMQALQNLYPWQKLFLLAAGIFFYFQFLRTLY